MPQLRTQYARRRAVAHLQHIHELPVVLGGTPEGPYLLLGRPAAGPEADHLEPWPVIEQRTMLSVVSMSRYGTFEYWPLIWDYNKKSNPAFANPNRVPMNITLKIRKLEKYSAAELSRARAQSPSWRNYPA